MDQLEKLILYKDFWGKKKENPSDLLHPTETPGKGVIPRYTNKVSHKQYGQVGVWDSIGRWISKDMDVDKGLDGRPTSRAKRPHERRGWEIGIISSGPSRERGAGRAFEYRAGVGWLGLWRLLVRSLLPLLPRLCLLSGPFKLSQPYAGFGTVNESREEFC